MDGHGEMGINVKVCESLIKACTHTVAVPLVILFLSFDDLAAEDTFDNTVITAVSSMKAIFLML